MLSIGSGNDIANAMIIHVVLNKLDVDSQNKWEEAIDFSSLLKWEDCAKVLSKRCQFLECREAKPSNSTCTNQNKYFENKSKPKSFARTQNTTTLSVSQQTRNSNSCALCKNSDHSIIQCSKFSDLSVLQRFNEAKKLSLCINCLRKGHSVKKCTVEEKCRVCSLPHHTLLHRYNNNSSSLASTEVSASSSEIAANSFSSLKATSSSVSLEADKVVLATALVQIQDYSGCFKPIRALLDSGSQLSFITDSMVQYLGLKKIKNSSNVNGIGNSSTKIRYVTSSIVKSRTNDFTLNIELLVLPNITGILPDSNLPVESWNIPKNLELADPLFFKQQRVDLLIGAEAFFDLLSIGQIKLGDGKPTLQKTLFGWIISGRYKSTNSTHNQKSLVTSSAEADLNESLDELVQKFWKIESFQDNSVNLTEEQKLCEEIFYTNVRRSPTGRIVVKLPFKKHESELGNSRCIAERRFYSLEKKLNKAPDLKTQYSEFLDEYCSLDHMELVPKNKEHLVKYYLPHHCVIKPGSSSTKVRVVFDGSCKTTSTLSLNDILINGPTVQEDLYSIIMRFRCHKFALKADICKMYRQFLVTDEDSFFQCILWRNEPSQDLRTFRLKTVTYGTSSASYLATKSLSYLAAENLENHPIASKIISRDFYVDDLLSGGSSLEEISKIRDEVDIVLKSAGMELKKWYSNDPKFLHSIPEENREKLVSIDGSDIIKTLGISWQPSSDHFKFVISNEFFCNQSITKRTVLSDLAKIFDPIGFINPVVVKAKIFLQKLWLLKLNWDESLPNDLHSEWKIFKEHLHLLNDITLPRFIFCNEKIVKTELHGFSDASLRAYGSCIYIRCIDINGKIHINMLTAKSRVAPTSTQSIPRLELCAALLLSNLLKKVIESLEIKFDNVILWTDSEIVLDWLAAHSSTWTVFVANRVAQIQELTKNYTWRHVNSKSNAADILSRGADVAELLESSWYTGPEFLRNPENLWPPIKARKINVAAPEQRSSTRFSLTASQDKNDFLEIIRKVSNYNKIVNIFAYVIRFTINCRNAKNTQSFNHETLTPFEREYASLKIVQIIQFHYFHHEILCLQQNKEVSPKSNIKSLNPYLEKEHNVELLKVGGRLKNSNIPYTAKCPLLLPNSNHFVDLLVQHLHYTNLHAGPQALLAATRQRFWIINGRKLVTKIVNKCVRCFHFRPKLAQQMLGDLPEKRVTPARPFYNSGVDFCGPVMISPGFRGKQLYKAYIAVFVCFSTHAVHLELVSSLTSEGFITCLKRFVARRGLCCHLHCDNATNFVGARGILAELRQKFQEQQFKNIISSWCSNQGIEFHHIPARSPHFGGIWEAAVKSAKKHLNHFLKDARFTFEELSTVLAQIEGILNSRPLSPLSSDPSDEQALTPGHFLIGHPLNAVPEAQYPAETKISSLKRFHRISVIQQHFWRRWSSEYLHSLQKRYKWRTSSPDLTIGTLVLIAEDNLPPQQWSMGRIVTLYPGRDNRVRVVDVKSKGKILRRQIHSLAPLPIDD